MLLQTSYCLVYEFCFVCHVRNYKSRPIKPCTFSHRSQVIFKDWLLLLWCCAYPLKPFIVEQRNRLVWALHVWFSENFFRNSRTKCPHIQQLLNHITIKRLRPWFFCVSTFPEIKEYKISVRVTFNKEIKKLLFLPSKMGGRLIHEIDLYTGKYDMYIYLVRCDICIYSDKEKDNTCNNFKISIKV